MSINAMIAASPIAAVVTDPRQPDNPIIACNQAFEVLTGYGTEEILGRNCRFLAGPDTEQDLSQQLIPNCVVGDSREGIPKRLKV